MKKQDTGYKSYLCLAFSLIFIGILYCYELSTEPFLSRMTISTLASFICCIHSLRALAVFDVNRGCAQLI